MLPLGRGFEASSCLVSLSVCLTRLPFFPKAEAKQQTLSCMETCRIDEIFCDSKFLRAESLVELVRSIIWASGIGSNSSAHGHQPLSQVRRASPVTNLPAPLLLFPCAAEFSPALIFSLQDDSDTAEVCLELLIGITIRNRDRVELLWPSVHAHLEVIIRGATHPAGPLVERAVLGLLRVCQRLLPYKEEISDELLRSLHLIFHLDPKVSSRTGSFVDS